jgi:hypothetical protein
MKTSKRNIMVLTLLLLIGSIGAHAECFTESLITSGPGAAYLGLRFDGVYLNHGQTFEVDCTSELESAALQLKVTEGGSYSGVPHLQAGDILVFALFSIDGSLMVVDFATMPHSDGTEWVISDFSTQQIILEPGSYFIAISPYDDKSAGIMFSPSDIGDGYKVTQHDDEWDHVEDNDINHEIVLTQDYVGNNNVSWGEVKAMFN